MSNYIPAAMRDAVRERAGDLCEYCLFPEVESFFPFEPDHVFAIKHRGPTELMNLANSCIECNRFKGTDIASIDPESGLIVRLFHPRRDRWADHFEMSASLILPQTDVGRVTVNLLQFNRPKLVAIRGLLIEKGRYPLSAGE